MMKLTRAEVEHVAKLANLQLSDEETLMFQEQLSSILSFVDKLSELDTDDVEPTSHVLPMTNVMREDQPHQSLDNDTALSNAPDEEDGYFKVPAVMD